jgi:hypothetical protein
LGNGQTAPFGKSFLPDESGRPFGQRPGSCETLSNLRLFFGRVRGWWQWFLAAITDVEPTEFIALENRSHNDIIRL